MTNTPTLLLGFCSPDHAALDGFIAQHVDGDHGPCLLQEYLHLYGLGIKLLKWAAPVSNIYCPVWARRPMRATPSPKEGW